MRLPLLPVLIALCICPAARAAPGGPPDHCVVSADEVSELIFQPVMARYQAHGENERICVYLTNGRDETTVLLQIGITLEAQLAARFDETVNELANRDGSLTSLDVPNGKALLFSARDKSYQFAVGTIGLLLVNVRAEGKIDPDGAHTAEVTRRVFDRLE